jgi:hypothetical protein
MTGLRCIARVWLSCRHATKIAIACGHITIGERKERNPSTPFPRVFAIGDLAYRVGDGEVKQSKHDSSAPRGRGVIPNTKKSGKFEMITQNYMEILLEDCVSDLTLTSLTDGQ